MQVGVLRLRLYIPWAHSLKEKRMVVKSILTRVRQVYNVSIAETAEQDLHQVAELSIACVGDSSAMTDSILDHVLNYVETHTDAQLTDVQREIR